MVISEKPSVAQSIARVLRVRDRKDGYIEGDGYIVSWCVGHLVGMAAPEVYDEKLKRWRLEDLPIIPDEWKYAVIPGTAKQFRIVKKLMNRRDVSEVVCATDAGREGELIFRSVYKEAECKKPVKRLWISSMEESAIKSGFENLRPSREFDNLYHAALARSKADWLVGMNASRLYSLKNDVTLNVGRVQTPVLNMIVTRERDIAEFKVSEYYTACLDFGTFTAESEEIKDKSNAESIVMTCQGADAEVKEAVTENKSQSAPKLYDLTALQRDANRQFGFTAKQTLDYAQSLYESKLITYPRTDSRYITSDVEPKIANLVNIAVSKLDEPFEGTVTPSRLTNNGKVSDHHAILPTMTLDKSDISTIPNGERSILLLICRRLLCALAEPYRYDSVKAAVVCEGVEFTAKGKTVTDIGWRRYSDKDDAGDKTAALPELEPHMRFTAQTAEVKKHKTKPPKHYTEDTLLSAMENAVKVDGAERCGLGTPATRAGIIEQLVKRGFLQRTGKNLSATTKGSKLISLVPDSVKSPDMTADWEEQLSKIAKGEETEAEFIDGIEAFVRDIIAKE